MRAPDTTPSRQGGDSAVLWGRCLAFFLLLTSIASASDLNYLILDVRTRQVIQQDWPDADQPIPVGSLVKPFTALASAGPFPTLRCHPDRCWLAQGHGSIGFVEALAHSCNSYFLQLAQQADAHSLSVVAQKFGIPPPDADTPETKIGLGTNWQISPLALTRAYCELTARASEPRIAEILAGLKLAAESGTAAAIGPGALAKTGTAPCLAKQKHKGDGFTLVLAPSDAPRIAILVRVHGVPGAEASKSAARIFHSRDFQSREPRERFQ
jgi:cell division protein FtsI/penicillin-binding protein 2